VDHTDARRESVATVIESDVNMSSNYVNIDEDVGRTVARPTITRSEDTMDIPSHEQFIAKPGISDDTLRFVAVADEFLQHAVSGMSSMNRQVVVLC